MSSIAISEVTFALVFGGALLGTVIGARLPKHHVNADTKDVVRLGMGLVGTIVAIALGLLIGSAYSYFNNQTRNGTCIGRRGSPGPTPATLRAGGERGP
jgi:hypothetical protein